MPSSFQLTSTALLSLCLLLSPGASLLASELMPAPADLIQALIRVEQDRQNVQAYKARHGKKLLGREAHLTQRIETGVAAASDLLKSMLAPDSSGKRAPAAEGAPEALKGRTIVLDAGHGGKDPGASGVLTRDDTEIFRLDEKDVALDVVNQLASRLEEAGARVLQTRSGDVTTDLYGRGIAARSTNADIFVSVHFNYSDLCQETPAGGRPVYGVNYTTVYTYAPAKYNLVLPGYARGLSRRLKSNQPAKTTQLAHALYQRLSDGLGLSYTPEPEVIKLMNLEKAHRARLARAAARKARGVPKAKKTRRPRSRIKSTAASRRDYRRFYSRFPKSSLPKGIRRADFVVLRQVHKKPAVLVETCFIGDRRELLRLRGKNRRQVIVDSLFQGIGDYFRQAHPAD